MEQKVILEYNDMADYPKDNFNPSKVYPEYLFSEEIQNDSNDVYDMIRNCLKNMELDKENFGKKTWNPLSKFIKPGDRVIIKPNWVMHFNEAKHVKENSIECLVTHPSCLRAICDYCLIALKGKGEVIIGDAPMQDCDLPVLLERAKFNRILEFYQRRNQPVKFLDFRKYQSTFDSNKVIINKIFQDTEGIDVDMGNLSMHERRNGKRIYQVDNYDRNETKFYHNENNHIYSINKTVLSSDVIINFCKPKSHRLAGFTAAMKNMVGIAYHKASLPHRAEGSLDEGGDAYLHKSSVKRIIDKILDKKIEHENRGSIALATIDRYLYGALLIMERIIGKDPYIKGIWYGNDTIWRTVVDLNYIEQYADKNGIIQDLPQRKILNFADMIVAGEHNGPCQPEPKDLGIILTSENAIAMDMVICKIMGFGYTSIPMIKGLLNHEADYLFGNCTKNINIISNKNGLNRSLEEIVFNKKWNFKPHDMWKYII